MTPNAPVVGKYVHEKTGTHYLELKPDGNCYLFEGSAGVTGTYEVNGTEIRIAGTEATSIGKIEDGLIIDSEGDRWVRAGGSPNTTVETREAEHSVKENVGMTVTCSRCGKERGLVLEQSLGGDSSTYTCSDCKVEIEAEEEHRKKKSTAQLRTAANEIMVTTVSELPGHDVVRGLGIVRGLAIRSKSIVGITVEPLSLVSGSNFTEVTQLCKNIRNEALERMLEHAAKLGANAVIGVRYDSAEIMPGVAEVFAYGTAVVVKPHA